MARATAALQHAVPASLRESLLSTLDHYLIMEDAERRRDRERERGLGFVGARHQEEIGLDAALLLDEEPVSALPSLALGELAGDEAVEPARAVLAGDEDRRAIGRGHHEHVLA
jgi:hypothetical protein